ncbi:MAG: type II toxin-antitoxin system RelE/ParE family toxin [Candidatus Dependentiae bacterium]
MMMFGNKTKLFAIVYLADVQKKDIPSLPASAKKMIQKAIEQRLMIDPIGYGKPLRYSLKGYRRLRVADYRVVYKIDQEKAQVIVIAIKHRKQVYD